MGRATVFWSQTSETWVTGDWKQESAITVLLESSRASLKFREISLETLQNYFNTFLPIRPKASELAETY